MIPDLASENLRLYLEKTHNALVKETPQRSMRGYLMTSFSPNGPIRIVLATGLSDTERVYMLTHFACHMVFGHHNRQAASIIEPSKSEESIRVGSARIDEEEVRQHNRAEILTTGVLENTIETDWDNLSRQLGENLDLTGLDYIRTRALLLRSQIHPFTMRNIGSDNW